MADNRDEREPIARATDDEAINGATEESEQDDDLEDEDEASDDGEE